MKRPTCKTCPYWHDIGEGEGDCKRNAPNTVIREQLKPDSEWGEYHPFQPFWATVSQDDWCGEHPDFPAYLESTKRTHETVEHGFRCKCCGQVIETIDLDGCYKFCHHPGGR